MPRERVNLVDHRLNIDHIEQILEMAEAMEADHVELANSQYYAWALKNRAHLMPSREQLQRAEAVTNRFRERLGKAMKIYFVVPDYYADRPKACMNGWGTVFLNIAPDGLALPCHEARMLPGRGPARGLVDDDQQQGGDQAHFHTHLHPVDDEDEDVLAVAGGAERVGHRPLTATVRDRAETVHGHRRVHAHVGRRLVGLIERQRRLVEQDGADNPDQEDDEQVSEADHRHPVLAELSPVVA